MAGRVFSFNASPSTLPLSILETVQADLLDYRGFVFLNAFSVDRARRKMIRERLCRKGGHALWHHAPGVIDPEARTLDAANMESLTGIAFTRLAAKKQLEPVLTGRPERLARSLPENLAFGKFRDGITTGDVIDLLSGRLVATDADTFTVTLEDRSTNLYSLGSEEAFPPGLRTPWDGLCRTGGVKEATWKGSE